MSQLELTPISTQNSPAHKQLQTLARMQSTLRHRRIEHLSFLQVNTIEFPSIASVTLAFHIAQPQKNQIKNSPRRRRLAQLQKYIERHGERVSRSQMTRIIFASPQKSRIAFQKTFRGSLYSTLSHKNSGGEGIKNSVSERQRKSLQLASDKIMHQKQTYKDFKTRLLEELGSKAIPEERYQGTTMEQSGKGKTGQGEKQTNNQPKRQLLNKIKMKNIQLSPERYSPWRSVQLQEDLVL